MIEDRRKTGRAEALYQAWKHSEAGQQMQRYKEEIRKYDRRKLQEEEVRALEEEQAKALEGRKAIEDCNDLDKLLLVAMQGLGTIAFLLVVLLIYSARG